MSQSESRFRFALVLFYYTISFLFLVYYAMVHADFVTAALTRLGMPLAGHFISFGFFLWFGATLSSWYLLRKRLAETAGEVPFATMFLSLLVLLAVVVIAWLNIFQWKNVSAALFLITHYGAPFAVLTSFWLAGRDTRATGWVGSLFSMVEKKRSFLSNLVLICLSLLSGSMAIEEEFRRILDAEPGPNQWGGRYDFVPAPYVMFAETDQENGGNLNTQGFNGPELPIPKGKNEIRVAMLGGSAAWSGVMEKNDIATHLQRSSSSVQFSALGYPPNFGRQSYVSMQELILLQTQVHSLAIDVLLIYAGLNDFWVPYKSEPRGVGFPYLFSNLKDRVEGTPGSYLVGILAHHSAAVNFMEKLAGEKRETTTKVRFPIHKAVAEYARNLEHMAVLARHYGMKTIFVLQPAVIQKFPETEIEQSFLNAKDREVLAEFYASSTETVQQVAAELNASFISLKGIFNESDEEVFSDAVHIYPKWNARVANALLQPVSDAIVEAY